MQVSIGGQLLDQFTLDAEDRSAAARSRCRRRSMGTAEMAELQIVVDKTFVPAH